MILSPQLIWFLAGVAFLVGEMVVPGFILIFFTAGCWFTALAVMTTNITLTAQVIAFIVSSLISLFILRKYCLNIFKGMTRDDDVDGYMDSKIGKTALVSKAIIPPVPGEIKVMGSFWRAIADEDIEEDRSVIIESQTSEDGLTFKVKPL